MTNNRTCAYCGVEHEVRGSVVCEVSGNKMGLPILKKEEGAWFAMELVTGLANKPNKKNEVKKKRLVLLDKMFKRARHNKNKNKR